MVRSFDFRRGRGSRRCDGRGIEKGVRDGTADALVKEDEDGHDFAALVRESIPIVAADPLDEAVGFQFADVVAELGEGVRVGCQPEGLANGLVEVGGAPTGQFHAMVEKDLHQSQDSRVVNLDARDARPACRDRVGEALEQGKIDVDVQAIGMGGGQAVSHVDEPATQGGQLVEAFGQPEITEAIHTHFDPEKGSELLVDAADQAFAVHP